MEGSIAEITDQKFFLFDVFHADDTKLAFSAVPIESAHIRVFQRQVKASRMIAFAASFANKHVALIGWILAIIA